jgi:hypothetical protein
MKDFSILQNDTVQNLSDIEIWNFKNYSFFEPKVSFQVSAKFWSFLMND